MELLQKMNNLICIRKWNVHGLCLPLWLAFFLCILDHHTAIQQSWFCQRKDSENNKDIRSSNLHWIVSSHMPHNFSSISLNNHSHRIREWRWKHKCLVNTWNAHFLKYRPKCVTGYEQYQFKVVCRIGWNTHWLKMDLLCCETKTKNKIVCADNFPVGTLKQRFILSYINAIQSCKKTFFMSGVHNFWAAPLYDQLQSPRIDVGVIS